MTREPGDLPAHRSLLPDPGDGHGTVTLRLSDEAVWLGLHGLRGYGCFVAPARRRAPTGLVRQAPPCLALARGEVTMPDLSKASLSKVPVTIITGFLGAGKETTLLRQEVWFWS